VGRSTATSSSIATSRSDVFARLRAALNAAGYAGEAVAGPVGRHRFLVGTETDSVGESDARLAALVRLFALGQPLPVTQARDALRPVDLEEIAGTGLLTVDAGQVTPEYVLRPYGQLLLAGDGSRPEDPDVVSAFTGPSTRLAWLTPRTRARSMLDVGTGSGILALLGARHCDEVTATDVNPRALMLARLNADLNDVPNLELVKGSWFEPVAGRVFDLIVCNPPYVVSPDREFVYRDSGLGGTTLLEQLTRHAAHHLAPGGLALMLCSWPHEAEDDWAAAPMGAVAGTGCDALILGNRTVDPFAYAVSWNSPPVSFTETAVLRETVGRWFAHYRAIGAGAITYGAIVVRRRTRGQPWVSTLRATTDAGERASEQLTAVFAGRDLLEADDDGALLGRRFSLPDGIDISQRFQRRESRFVARPAMVGLDGGLGVSVAVDPDMLRVVFACDGRRTLSEVVERVDGAADAAVAVVRELLIHGLLRVE